MEKLCRNCQAPLAADAPQGLCPACLMKVAMATGTVGGQEKPGFTPPSIEELARKFPQLEVIELIGRGGMGAVYKARQKELDRIVALKILPPGIGDDAAFAERFSREAKALARLNHPGIISIHDFGRADGLYFFVMEFVDGVNLRQLLANGRVSPREALAIVPQICDALQFAHDQGIVHRDIKPENILLDRRGRVKVADFGLAKLVEAELPLTPTLSPSDGERGSGSPDEKKTPALTDAGKVMGTPAYMAPEQIEHPAQVDHRADIYALGVVFYQMLTGELPGKAMEPPSKKVRVDVRLDEVVLRALDKEPELRFQQVSEVKTAVENISSEQAQELPATTKAWSPPDELAPEAAAVQGRLRLVSAVLFAVGCACLWGPSLLSAIASLLPPENGMSLMRFVALPGPTWLLRLSINSLGPLIGALALVNAWKVRRLQDFRLSLAAVVLAALQPGLWLLTVPLAVIALATLCRKQVRDAFATQANLQAGLAGSEVDSRLGQRLAVASAVLVLVSALTAPITALLRPDLASVGGAALLSVILLNWFPQNASLVGLMLGWLALHAMRRTAPRPAVLFCALFAILFTPILMLVRWFDPAPAGFWSQSNLSARWLASNSLLAVLFAAFFAWQLSRGVTRLGKTVGSVSRFMPRVSWTMGVVVLACAGILVLGFGSRRTVGTGAPADNEISTFFYMNHRHTKPEPDHEGRAFAGHLDSGIVALQAVCDPLGPDWTCWLPDGTEWCPQSGLAQPRFTGRNQRRQGFSLPSTRRGKSSSRRDLIFYLTAVGDLLTNLDRLHYECYVTNGGAAQLCPASMFDYHDRKNYHGFAATVPTNASVARLRLGLPAGAWEDTDAAWIWTGDARQLSAKSIRHGGEDWEVTVQQVDAHPDGLSVTFGCQLRWNGEPRVVAVDTEGNVHEPTWQWVPGAALAPFGAKLTGIPVSGKVLFPGMVPSQLKELRFQIQPYRWVEFRDVSLEPGSHTHVEVVDSKNE
jgi:serine/threonine protein kinase